MGFSPPVTVKFPLSLAEVSRILLAPVELVTVGATGSAEVVKVAEVSAQSLPPELTA